MTFESAESARTEPRLLASLTQANASGHSEDQTNIDARGVQVAVDITAISGVAPR